MTTGNWGGSAGGGGFEFQAAASALCMVHMARGTPLSWSAAGNDIPLSVSAEIGGTVDDIALQLDNGNVLEIQAKRKLQANSQLWDALIALCRRAHEEVTFYGVLAVGPTTSVAIRDQLARDIIRLGQGRADDLSQLAIILTKKLSAASIPYSVCDRVRIQTLHLLEQDDASAQSALAHLAHITTQPAHAWERLQAEGLRLIRLRGRRDAVSVAGIIPGLRESTSGPLAPALVARQLLEWTLSTTETFTIPAVDKLFSLDDDWIELNAHARDKLDVSLGSLEEALTRYHEGRSRTDAGHERDTFSAESLGYFVRQCVVVAGPGMGKTQLLRRIARLLARKGEPSLFVRLRPLAERMRAGHTFLEAALHIGLDAPPLTPQDVRTLGMQNLTLLLDGLDESGSEQEEIARAAAALATSYPRCRIVFTTRPIGYETAFLNTWRHYELAPIESSDAKLGVERLVDAATDIENARVKEATAAATSHMNYTRDYKFSARSPLLIALLASLSLNEVIAAATREGLYGQLFRLIEGIATKRVTTSVTPAVLNAFLHQLGWELNAQPYADVERALAVCAQHLAIELDERPLKAHSICEEALAFWEKAGIIERVRFKASEALTFVHKTFGEYAAARYVCSRPPDERRQLLAAIEPEQRWNEVVVFTSALGLGPDLVHLALIRAREDSSETSLLLRWARHSRDPLKADLAEPVLQHAWAIIAGQHSGHALSAGIDLVVASDKLPGVGTHAESYLSHPQWWSALVGWACFVRANPDRLDFPTLLAFMESYAESVDTRKVTGGLVLNDPVRQLWEQLLLPSAREAVRRGIGPEEQIFIDRIQESLGARSMGFFRELASILKEAGVNVKLPGQEDLFSKYFSPEYFEESRQDTIALLEAIAELPSSDIVPVDAPLLHLSAFWYGTGLMNMELSAAVLAAKDSGRSEVRQIVALAARLSAYDHGQLIAEAQAKIHTLKSDDGLIRTFDGLLSVDAPMEFHGKPDSSSTRPVIYRALLHPSEWIVNLAANLAEHLLTADDIAELVPQVLSESKGLGMVAAAHLAIHSLGKERARELIVARLKRPLNSGCQHLFSYLADVWTPELDVQVNEILKPALFFGPRTAKAALDLARACGEPHRKGLSPLLKEAYDYWLENEEQYYPTAGGVISESPRGEILALMIEEEAASSDDLFEAAQDPRSDVSQPATNALLTAFSMSDAARNELVRRVQSGEKLDSLLSASLRARAPFSEKDVQSIAELLESGRPQTRYAVVGVLDLQYLAPDEIRKWAEKLIGDPYQHLRDKGHERLSALKGEPSSGTS